MKRINLLRSSFLFLLFPFFLTSCGGNTTETPKEYSATNPRTIKEVNLDSEPVELVAPFTVLTETGETGTRFDQTITLNFLYRTPITKR